MKTRASIVIPVDRKTVWAALVDFDRRTRWQTGLQKARLLSGDAGERGTVCQLTYGDSRPVEIESVTEARRPDLLATVIESDRYRRTVVHKLEEAGDGHTRWTAWSNTRSGALTQLRALFQRSALADTLEEDMERFKLMIQSEQANRPS